MSSESDKVIERETAEALVSWLEAFPNRPLQQRLSHLLDRRRKLDLEIDFLQAQLSRYRQYVQDLVRPVETTIPKPGQGVIVGVAVERDEAAPIEARRESTPEYPAKRTAVLRLLNEDRHKQWRLADIRDELIRRGWLSPDEKARHALQVLMLNMTRRGEVLKPATGVYQSKRSG
jgi:hypothetical protein